MAALDRCYNIHDLRAVAKKRLPRGIFEFVDRGTEEGVALAENRAAFDRLRLLTRFMVDLSKRDMGTTIFGQRSALPFAIGPTGGVGLLWPQGELALARAAAAVGIPFALATGSTTSIETIARAGGRLWFQLYMLDEVDISYDMVARARDLNYEALIVTIDSGLGRVREHNERNGYDFPFRPNMRAFTDMMLHPGWLIGVLLRSALTTGAPKTVNYPAKYQRLIDWGNAPRPRRYTAMTWKDIAKLRAFWPRKLLVKATLSATDARLAVEHGADGVIVSNHGGRAMDSALSTIEALPEIVAAVGDRATVMLDGGVRRGSDVAKALAIGAKMVLLGRATLYGVAAGGQPGAEKALGILASEFEKTMGYLGCRTVDELDREIFARPMKV
ncbi:MAG TPA: alpha-hydroxy acid oxidase [Dongiaceae bacterium]|jgi:isopentenyl diphosphate isomerase/L-lactate dehydrogenase-like FMN-dependent dehydrogenase|nr:alpha-hydroxy acid oxidase [Dongiaceae bacterium]